MSDAVGTAQTTDAPTSGAGAAATARPSRTIAAIAADDMPAGGAPAGAAKAAVPAAVGPGWAQIKDAAIPALCGHDATQLVDGRDVNLGAGEGRFELLQTLVGGAPALAQDLDAGGRPVTAAVAECDAGGVAWPHLVLFFRADGTYQTATMLDSYDWSSLGLSGPARNGISRIDADGARLTIGLRAERLDDPSCCPSATVELRVSLAGDGATIDDAVVTDG